jgi:hypothetical protein
VHADGSRSPDVRARDLIVHHGWPDVDDRTLVEMEMGEF